MQATETICANCRAQLEAQVFAVRAEDYPVPARPVRKSERILEHEMVPMASTVEAQLASAVDAAADLVPPTPAEEPQGRMAVGAAAAVALVDRPAPPPTPVEMQTPVEAMRSAHTSRNVMIVLIAVVVTAILAAGVWSFVVPPRSAAAQEPTHVSR